MRVSLASAPGSPDKPNEDWVGATTNVVVVLDGITNPDGLPTGCEHGTVWFIHQLGAWLLGLASTEPDVSLRDHLAASIRNVADTHADTCDTTHPNTPGATVAMLREVGDQVEWLVLADAFVVLATPAGTFVHSDGALERCTTIERAALRGKRIGTPEHTAARRVLLAVERKLRNAPGGFWVASAIPEAAEHATVGQMPKSNVSLAAVLSDGAAGLASRGGKSWPDLLSLLNGQGPLGLIQEVRAIEAGDPSAVRHPRTKVRDDATVAYCEFEHE